MESTFTSLLVNWRRRGSARGNDEIGPIGTAARAGGVIAIAVLCSGLACVLSLAILGIAIGVSAATPVDFVAFWVWLGASMLLAAARGYAGCELLAFPNAVTGRRDRIGCLLYTPIEEVEARGRGRREAPSPAEG